MTGICVVIPALNEARCLRTLLPRIPERLLGEPIRVIVVNDGSTDGTERVARQAGADVLSFPANRGKAEALRSGLDEALRVGGRLMVTMDADGQHDPTFLEDLVGPVALGRWDISIGSRYLRDPGLGSTPLNRYLVRRATISWLRRVLGRHHSDPYSGYRCFSRAALARIALGGDRYQCELEQLFDAAAHGLRIVEVPVPRRYGRGTTKMGGRRGRLVGRIGVVWQYVSTIRRRTRELRRPIVPAVVESGVEAGRPL